MRDRQQRLSYSLPAILGREKGQERRLGRERGLSPSDPGVSGAVRPDVLGVAPLSGAEDLGPRFPGSAPHFSDTQVPALIFQVSGTPVPTSLNLGLCLLEFQVSGIRAPACITVRGSLPRRSDTGFSLPLFRYTGLRPHHRKSGIQQLSPSRRGRTGPRGQIGWSPPPLQGRLPGPAPQEGRPPRQRWQGERPPCPSPCLAVPLEEPGRKRRRWGTTVTPTRPGPTLRAPRGHHASWGPGREPEGPRCGRALLQG